METPTNTDPRNRPAWRRRAIFWQVLGLLLCVEPLVWGYQVQRWQVRDGLPSNNVTGVEQTADGYLWINTEHGAVRFDGVRFQRTDEFPSFEENKPKHDAQIAEEVTAEAADKGKGTWMGTAYGRLFLKTANSLELIFSSDTRFPRGRINDILVSRNGNVWIASQGGGLLCVQRAIARTFGFPEGIALPAISCLTQESPGRIFAGTLDSGLFVLEGERFHGPLALVGADKRISAMTSARTGGIWMTVDGESLLKLGGAGSGKWGIAEGFPTNRVLTLYDRLNGELWLGTDQGAWRFQEGTFKRWTPGEGLETGRVNTIVEEGGSLWLGTAAGLFCLKEGETTFQRAPFEWANLEISALHPGKSGHLWVGTKDKGLFGVGQDALVHVGQSQGLPSDGISAVLEDSRGNLWIATGRGLASMELAALSHLDSSGCLALPGPEFIASTGSLIEASDRTIWFTTSQGLTQLDPRSMPFPQKLPEVQIEEVKVNGVLSYSNLGKYPSCQGCLPEFLIPPGRTHLEVAYSALFAPFPTTTQFQIKVDGIDPNWRHVGTRRMAYFDGLSAGRYTFRVRTLATSGEHPPAEASFVFEVESYFWERGWVMLTAGLCAGGLMLLAVHTRDQRKQRALAAQLEQTRVWNQERSRIARDMHDELGSCLTRISMLSNAAAGALAQSTEHHRADALQRITRVSDLSRSLVTSMDEIVWAINPLNDSLEEFATYLSHYVQELFSGSSVSCRLVLDDCLPPTAFKSRDRHQLFLVVKEALHNVLKHSGATSVTVAMEIKSGVLELTVSDNGRGIQTSPGGRTGNGMKNMTARVHQIGGTLAVESLPGQGTTIRMSIPLPDEQSSPEQNQPQTNRFTWLPKFRWSKTTQ